MLYVSVDKIITNEEFNVYRKDNSKTIDAEIFLTDIRKRSSKQNDIMHCLFREIAVWSCGYETPKEELEYKKYMKKQYSDKPFKTSEMTVAEASDFIAFIIDASWYSCVVGLLSTQKAQKIYLRTKKYIDRIAGSVLGILGLKLALDRA